MNKSHQLNVLLITSFHRSGSSMVGKILSNSGLFVGENLIHGAHSNPDGHYEDFDIVQAQEKILIKCGSSWQFDGTKPLLVDEEDINHLTELVASRYQNHSLWGFKDPRSCLFLEDWAKILGETGHYLFLYRHYSQCIASLYRRHSRIICIDQIGQKKFPRLPIHLKFWVDGNLASRMWIAYNRRLLNFYKKNRNESLLVSQQAVLSGYPLIQALNNKFNFMLNTDYTNTIKEDYVHNQICQYEIKGIGRELIEEMDELWDEMNHWADAPASTPCSNPIESQFDLSGEIESLINFFNASYNKETTDLLNAEQHPTANLSTEEQIRQALTNGDIKSALTLLPSLIDSKPLSAEEWILSGTVYMRAQAFEKAQQSFSNAIDLNPNRPYFYMRLGLSFLAQDKKSEAEYFLHLAAEKNPKNPTFFFQLGNLYSKYEQFDKAKNLYQKALNIAPGRSQFIIGYSRCLINMGEEEEALSLLKIQCQMNPEPAVVTLYASLLQRIRSYSESLPWHNFKNLSMLKNTDLRSWQKTILAQISDTEMRDNFEYWIYLHWKDIKADHSISANGAV